MTPPRRIVGVLLAACLGVAVADEPERARIARERADAEAAFRQAEAACQQRFAVTGCVEEARAERRAVLQRLKAREQSIDEQQRRRRAAQREAEVRDKLAARDERVRAAAAQPPRPAASAPVPRAPSAAASRPARAASRPDRSAIEARSRAEYLERQRSIEAHREEVARRNAERAAKARAPLPAASKP